MIEWYVILCLYGLDSNHLYVSTTFENICGLCDSDLRKHDRVESITQTSDYSNTRY